MIKGAIYLMKALQYDEGILFQGLPLRKCIKNLDAAERYFKKCRTKK